MRALDCEPGHTCLFFLRKAGPALHDKSGRTDGIILMDYDRSDIATTYDQARALTPARHQRWQRLLSAHVDRSAISLVVDLGCGTGRFSEMLAAELGAWVMGFDRSEKMIEQARRKPVAVPVAFAPASAHALPLADGCVDLVFISQVYHHLPAPAAVAQECWRVLRGGGYVCVRTGTRENNVVAPRFFPAVRAMLDADLPSSDQIKANFIASGGGFGAFLAHPPFIALLAQAPPISIARSVSLRRSVFRKGSTPCS